MKKAAIIGLLVGVVMAVINLASLMCGCVGCLNCIIMFVPGALSAFMLMNDGISISNGEGAKLGAVSGLTSSVIPLIVNTLVLLLGGAAMYTDKMTQAGASSADIAMITGMMGIITIVMIPISLAMFAGANALSGFLYVLIKNR